MIKKKIKYLVRFYRRYFWWHKWEYWNPFDRECTVCGRHEVWHCWAWEMNTGKGWWEIFNDGDTTKHTN